MDSKGGGRAKAGEFETELEKILIYQTGPKWDRWMKIAKGRKSHATFPLNYYAEVTCCRNPVLVGQVFVGGSLLQGGPVKVIRDPELSVKIQLLGGGGRDVFACRLCSSLSGSASQNAHDIMGQLEPSGKNINILYYIAYNSETMIVYRSMTKL
jgi:hypothetical protein